MVTQQKYFSKILLFRFSTKSIQRNSRADLLCQLVSMLPETLFPDLELKKKFKMMCALAIQLKSPGENTIYSWMSYFSVCQLQTNSLEMLPTQWKHLIYNITSCF